MWMGIDGCRGGWVIASLASGHPSFDAIEIEVVEVLGQRVLDRSLNCALVDMPIGLLKDRSRRIETLARRAMPGQGSTVFNVPVADAVYAASYPEASAINAARTGKKLSKQAWYLCPKIREIDELLGDVPELTTRMFESHPELVYRCLRGSRLERKKTPEGQDQRAEVLRSAGLPVDSLLHHIRLRYPKRVVLADDVLDALVLLLVARGRSKDLDPTPEVATNGRLINLRIPDLR